MRVLETVDALGTLGPLEPADVLSILPHRQPFVLVDRVVSGIIGREIEAERFFSVDDPLLTESGTLPMPLLIEAIAQAAALLLLSGDRHMIPVFRSIEKATFSQSAHAYVPATRILRIHAEICWRRQRLGQARGTVTTQCGDTLCEAVFTFGGALPSALNAID